MAQGRTGRRAAKKRDIACADEVLEYLTRVMRGEDAKESFRAAELLGKHFDLFRDGGRGEMERVVLVNDVESRA